MTPPLRTQLKTLLEQTAPEDIWRPVSAPDGELLAEGHEDMRDGSPDVLAQVDFAGKNVLDLGCNFGFYSLLAKRQGAASVVGVDIDQNVICGCRLLARLYGYLGMEFIARDFTGLALDTCFDCILLINFIGKKSICKGIVPILETVRTLSRGDIILSARPVYNISHSLQSSPEQLVGAYGGNYIRKGSLYLVEFLRDFFGDHWVCSIISPDYADQTLKRTLLFSRKQYV
jgi:SAM-dependent methyltransferase